MRKAGMFVFVMLGMLSLLASCRAEWTVTYEVVLEATGWGEMPSSGSHARPSATATPDPSEGTEGTRTRYRILNGNDDLLSIEGKTNEQIYTDRLTAWRNSIGDFQWNYWDGNTPADREAITHIVEARDEAEAAYWTLRLMQLKNMYYGPLPSEEEFYALQAEIYATGDETTLQAVEKEPLPDRGRALTEEELALFPPELGEITYARIIGNTIQIRFSQGGTGHSTSQELDEYNEWVWLQEAAEDALSGRDKVSTAYYNGTKPDENGGPNLLLEQAMAALHAGLDQNAPSAAPALTGAAAEETALAGNAAGLPDAESTGDTEATDDAESTGDPEESPYPTVMPDVEVIPYSAVTTMLTPSRSGMSVACRYLAQGNMQVSGSTLTGLNEGIEDYVGPWWNMKERYTLTIESPVNGVPITRIGDHAFDNFDIWYKYFIVPDGVESIGSGAFTNQHMEYVLLPDTLTELAPTAFNCCSSLTAVSIPESVTTLKAGVFAGCDNLRYVVIPASVTDISDECIAHADPARVQQVVIYGYGGSAAEQYALRNGLHFVDIGIHGLPEEATPAPTAAPETTNTPAPEVTAPPAATPDPAQSAPVTASPLPNAVTPEPEQTADITPTPEPEPDKAALWVSIREIYLNEEERTVSVGVQVGNSSADGVVTAKNVRVYFQAYQTEDEGCRAESSAYCGSIAPGASTSADALLQLPFEWIEYMPGGWPDQTAQLEMALTLNVRATCDNGRSARASGSELSFLHPDWLTRDYPNVARMIRFLLEQTGGEQRDSIIRSLRRALDHQDYRTDESLDPAMRMQLAEQLPVLRRQAFSRLNDALADVTLHRRSELKGKGADSQPSCLAVSDNRGVRIYLSYVGTDDMMSILFHEGGHALDYITVNRDGDASSRTTMGDLEESIVTDGKRYISQAAQQAYACYVEKMKDALRLNPGDDVSDAEVLEGLSETIFKDKAAELDRDVNAQDVEAILARVAAYWYDGSVTLTDEETAFAQAINAALVMNEGKAYDVLSAVTDKRMLGESGHDAAYWAADASRKAQELWGHFFSAVCRGDGKELQLIHDTFPQAYDMMCVKLQSMGW